jgi:O-antigen ligase/polysaccharide polymerase Wzy-like membrane protein
VSTPAGHAELPLATRSIALPGLSARTLATVVFGTLLAALALQGQGGLQLGPLTTVEIAVEILAGLVGAAAVLFGARAGLVPGAVAIALFAGLVAFTALSIGWAVETGDAWIEANRTLAWFAAFALGVALARLWPDGWSMVLGGLIFAAVEVCGYAVLTKAFPAAFNPGEIYARLREPFGYWNSVGLLAAMGGPACLWLGARRSGHAAVNALAYPALALLLVACLLAYSRGALLALALGCAFWFGTVPLRLRGAVVLAIGGAGGLAVGLWAFGVPALSTDRVALDARVAAGDNLGILLVAMLACELVAGLAVGFAHAEHAPSLTTRWRAGALALTCVALVPVVMAGWLATSERGLGGSISKAWTDLTDPNATPPANDPTRLAAIGSVRARYWDEALKIWRANEAVGVGAGGYRTARPRYRQDTLNVRHAHGYVVQTLADLGLVGLAISLALLAAWIVSAVRSTGPWRRSPRGSPFTPERIGLLTMCSVVIVFGVHSTVDWTWFVPGNAVLALVLAGWVSGRVPPLPPHAADAASRWSLRAASRNPVRIAGAATALAIAGVAAWTTWQPQRSVNASDAALVAVEANRLPDARADVRRARRADSLSTTPLYVGATVESAAGNDAGARRLLEEATRMQPSSSEPWLRLAQFDLDQNDPRGALRALGPALYLDPRSAAIQQTHFDASLAETERRDAAKRRKRGG